MSLIPTTIETQVRILESRNMILPPDAARILTQYGYYNLINGYKDLFLDKDATRAARDDRYQDGTRLEHLVCLSQFDFALRAQLFRSVSLIEAHVKSLISLHFSLKYGACESAYLSEASYRKGNRHIASLIEFLRDDVTCYSMRVPHPAITHSLKKYQKVPIWILQTVISFGTMSKMYDSLTDDLKKNIAKAIHPNLKPAHLSSMLYFLTGIRNKCAHNNRVFSHSIDQQARRSHRITALNAHKYLGIPKSSTGSYLHGQDDILAAFIIFSFFSKSAHTPLIHYDQLDRLFQHLEQGTNPRISEEVRELTGLKRTYLALLQNSGDAVSP